MRTRIMIGCAIAASAALGAFAASGFGERGDRPAELRVSTLDTHRAGEPPAGAPAVDKRAALFKVLYRTTDPTSVASGYSSWTLTKCPKRSAVLNGFHLRSGADTSGVRAAGGFPNGTREWTYVVENVTGGAVDVGFGIICIK